MSQHFCLCLVLLFSWRPGAECLWVPCAVRTQTPIPLCGRKYEDRLGFILVPQRSLYFLPEWYQSPDSYVRQVFTDQAGIPLGGGGGISFDNDTIGIEKKKTDTGTICMLPCKAVVRGEGGGADLRTYVPRI